MTECAGIFQLISTKEYVIRSKINARTLLKTKNVVISRLILKFAGCFEPITYHDKLPRSYNMWVSHMHDEHAHSCFIDVIPVKLKSAKVRLWNVSYIIFFSLNFFYKIAALTYINRTKENLFPSIHIDFGEWAYVNSI